VTGAGRARPTDHQIADPLTPAPVWRTANNPHTCKAVYGILPPASQVFTRLHRPWPHPTVEVRRKPKHLVIGAAVAVLLLRTVDKLDRRLVTVGYACSLQRSIQDSLAKRLKA
jgi:hypothetical protein